MMKNFLYRKVVKKWQPGMYQVLYYNKFSTELVDEQMWEIIPRKERCFTRFSLKRYKMIK